MFVAFICVDQVPVASVAAGFPAGQTPMTHRLAEIRDAVRMGAREIDIVITRTHVLTGNWKELYAEVKSMREACGEAHLKTILATGHLGTLTNVYKVCAPDPFCSSFRCQTVWRDGDCTVTFCLTKGKVILSEMPRRVQEHCW